MDSKPLRVTIWNEFRHEKANPEVAAFYPDGMHEALAAPSAPPATRSAPPPWTSRSMA